MIQKLQPNDIGRCLTFVAKPKDALHFWKERRSISEDAAGASALVVDADAVEDSRRLRERARVCRQLMEELYRVAKVEYDEDGNYDKLKEIEETYYSTITSSI